MARYAVVTTVDIPATDNGQGSLTQDYPVNAVINIIELDDVSDWPVPANTLLVQSDTLNIGDINV